MNRRHREHHRVIMLTNQPSYILIHSDAYVLNLSDR
jgi:hypothetical protein